MSLLFQHGDFKLHSGQTTSFRINAERLGWTELDALAHQLVAQLDGFRFSMVIPIPRGGVEFAQLLSQHITPGTQNVLLVDDVYTTGASFREWKKKQLSLTATIGEANIRGGVIFARSKPPEWITPIFLMYDDVTRRRSG
jgi:orotate phosphoribosyltransferase